MRIITLLTDFGTHDGFAGIMKGVIWGIAPDVQIVDLTHLIPPQDVLEGAIVLNRASPYFPPGTVHIAVVDPGVGTARRAIAAQIGEQFFVAPDNGLLSMVIRHAEEAGLPLAYYHLNQPQYWLSIVSTVFHGRDIFAPVGAHLAQDTPLSAMGEKITDPARLNASLILGADKGDPVEPDIDQGSDDSD